MKRSVDHSAMSAAGYTVPWSGTAGAKVALHLSSDSPVRKVEIRRLDALSEVPLAWRMEPLEPVRHRSFDQGSYLVVRRSGPDEFVTLREIRFELFLTRNENARTVLDAGLFRLSVDDCTLILERSGHDSASIANVPLRCWLGVTLRGNESGLVADVHSYDDLAPFHASAILPGIAGDWTVQRLTLGAGTAGEGPSLNARFSGIRLDTPDGCHAWRFPTRLTLEPMPSDHPDPLFIEAVNLPTFCVTSVRWDGNTFDPRMAPAHYDAIHCHDDDMGALDWPACFEAGVPEDADPGIYAFDVETERGREQFVFFVKSARRRADIVFLVPTATYLAYSDEALPPHLYEWKCEDRGHRFAVGNELRSLYDYHNDRSGVSICSWRKPKATLRGDYNYPLCGCPHNLPVDLRLLRFCHEHGLAFDLLTDHDLHENGHEALAGYRILMTGSHPEYMSVEMEQAIRDFAAGGGNIAYLGGNGFAATVAFDGDLMELRRSPLEAGRTWDGPIAEQALAITNEPGGFLRSRGRGEFSLIGVAISLMGFDGARPYSRTPESHEAKFAWLFEGVENEVFGNEGIVLGGAAGYEVDATDPHLGTPGDTVVLARATGFHDGFFHDPARWYQGGEEEAASRRCAEMTIRVLPGGNWIYSASSVAWCGALPEIGLMNDVGRITLNLLSGGHGH